MKNQCSLAMFRWAIDQRDSIRMALTGLLIVLSLESHGKPLSENEDDDSIGVGMTGVQHIGQNFNISEFYVDGNWGGNVSREGGGGGTVCCAMLPRTWRPGLTAEIRWSVADWSKEKKTETKAGNYQSIDWKNYKAIVPIEKYEKVEKLYIHFFSNGKVRAVSSIFGAEGRGHPIHRHDDRAEANATVGKIVNSLFTNSEIEEITKKNNAEKSANGSWK